MSGVVQEREIEKKRHREIVSPELDEVGARAPDSN